MVVFQYAFELYGKSDLHMKFEYRVSRVLSNSSSMVEHLVNPLFDVHDIYKPLTKLSVLPWTWTSFITKRWYLVLRYHIDRGLLDLKFLHTSIVETCGLRPSQTVQKSDTSTGKISPHPRLAR